MEATNSNTANLNILRTFAVSLVVFDHVAELIGRQSGVFIHPVDWELGRLGVLFFFVHTSLVLHYSMQRMRQGGWELVRTFLIRRAFRIYPLSIACVAAMLAFHVPRMPWEQFATRSTGNVLSNLALTMNLTFSTPVLGPLWSLPIELQMYVALPAIFLVLGKNRLPLIALSLWVGAVLVALVHPSISDRANVLAFAPCFIGGVFAYTLSSRVRSQVEGRWWIWFLLAITVIYLPIQLAMRELSLAWAQWLLCLLLGAAIPVFKDSGSTRVNVVAARMAQYSYGIYLFHCVALWVAFYWMKGVSAWVQWPAAVAVLGIFAVGGYHCLEKPAIDLSARITQRRIAPSATLAV